MVLSDPSTRRWYGSHLWTAIFSPVSFLLRFLAFLSRSLGEFLQEIWVHSGAIWAWASLSQQTLSSHCLWEQVCVQMAWSEGEPAFCLVLLERVIDNSAYSEQWSEVEVSGWQHECRYWTQPVGRGSFLVSALTGACHSILPPPPALPVLWGKEY